MHEPAAPSPSPVADAAGSCLLAGRRRAGDLLPGPPLLTLLLLLSTLPLLNHPALCPAPHRRRPPPAQAQYLRDLNRQGQHDAVIQLFESERLAPTEAAFGQYIKALAKTDRLSSTALMQTLYRGAQSYMGVGGGGAGAAAAARAAAAEAAPAGSFAASTLRPAAFGGAAEPAAALGGAAGAALGSAKNPVRHCGWVLGRCCCCAVDAAAAVGWQR